MQISTRPQDARKIISASLPHNISAIEKEALQKKWDEAAKKRAEDISNETRIPTEPSITLNFRLKKYGKHWNAEYKNGVKFLPLLPAPSLLSSAMDALYDKMADQALNV